MFGCHGYKNQRGRREVITPPVQEKQRIKLIDKDFLLENGISFFLICVKFTTNQSLSPHFLTKVSPYICAGVGVCKGKRVSKE